MPRIDPVIRCIRRGGFAIALLASLLPASDGRAQAAACTPTQTVGAQAENGVYTTTLTCADTSAAAGAADYRQLHYNHGAAYGANPADRDADLANNNAYNNLALTIGRGVIFTADGYNDNRLTVTDGAILLWNAGAKTVTVEDGAVINLERTPAYWTATDPDRPMSATPQYDPAWYPTWRHALDNLVGIGAYSYTGTDGDADIAIGHHGVIVIDIDIGGTYGKNGYYDASAGRAIDVQVKDTGGAAAARADLDVLIEMGATGVIRHEKGSDGLSGIYAENFSEEGDIRIDLAEGSLIDVSEGGGYGVTALLRRDATNNNGQRTGDLIVNAAGTIRAAARSRVQSFQHGYGIFAEQGGHTGRVRVVSSGTIETVQGPAIDARAWRSTQMHRDDPDTAEIEGHVVDVTAKTVETRGTTAVYASTGSANSHMTVRVKEGAAVRARALTDEDYENGALTQETLGADGSPYIISGIYRYHGWRRVDVEQTTDSGATVTVKRLEPIITGIAVRDFSSSPNADGLRDRVIVDGTVETVGGKAGVDPAIWLESGGLVTVGANGRVSADSGIAISGGCFTDYRKVDFVNIDSPVDCDTTAPRTLEVRVAGTVEGDIRVLDDGVLNFRSIEGGTVAGTVHDPAGPLTVAGSVGRLLYTSGGAVTVTRTGALTGVDGVALRSEAGDLSLTVAGMGMVTGDVRARGGGRLTVDVKEGGTISGTVHDPAGPLTVAGSIGRVLYSSGGAVTVTGTGRLTGVDGVALRSESGDLSLTVADKGMVTGDVRARGGGRLTLDLKEGGTIAGTVHDPVGPLTVAGSIGRLLYADGAAVTVTDTGRLTGVDGVALRSNAGDVDLTVAGLATGDIDARGDGDLTVRVSGTVDGDIFGRGAGEHTVTVARGGAVTGTVNLGASTVMADGAVGRVRFERGGAATVGSTGRISGVDGVAVDSRSGDLTVTVDGMATGDIDGRGGGDLTVMVSGTVDGDVFGRDAGEHAVTVARGGAITGTVDLGGDGAVTVKGAAGRVRFGSDGAVEVGPEGRIPGRDGVSIESRSGAPAVTIVATADESLGEAVGRVGGAIVAAEGEPSVSLRREGETVSITLGGLGTARSVPEGAYDVGVVRAAGGALRAVSRLAPRTRVYEALPSLLLGMERPASHAERMAAPRASDGAWARVAASRGSWEAAKSANAGTEYDRRGFSFQAGVDAVLSEETRAGLSVHWRRATAKVSRNGGEIEARGAGVGLSATWSPGPFFVDGQAAATLYDVDLKSTLRGRLKDDVGAQGLSAALEAGRTVPVADGVTVTPRARVAYSSLSLSDFVDDAAGARVSLDRGRSLTGRAGALAERVFGEGRIFGSVDIEREFSAETRMSVAGTSLETAGEATRWLVGVGGEHGWEEGRFALRGALDYAASGGGARDYGARASLSMRF